MSKLVSFQPLWDNHPAVLGELEPCKNAKGESAFANQCAIRMGIALKAAGVTTSGLVVCWHGHSGQQHILQAEPLAGWMLQQKQRFGTAEKKVGKNHDATKGVTHVDYKGRKGVVFFKDFWFRDKEKFPTGDHIDVWNGERQGSGNDDYFERSKQVWFWELK